MSGFVRSIEIELLDRRADARAIDAGAVAAIASSFAEVGQMNPIRVRPRGDRFEIVAGVHRVEACRALGLVEVDALIVETGELFAELAMIDENLCRAELGPADRARQTARRKQIYEEVHPETAHGGDRTASRQVGDLNRFSADTAARTGASERSVQRDAARGERIRDEALDAVAGTELDTGVFLDELKAVEPDEQLGHVRNRLNGERAIAALRQEPEDSLDYFPTPPWATRALIALVLPRLGVRSLRGVRVWEPACGEGHMSGVLAEYSDDVLASDIAGYGSAEGLPPGWIGRHDFLDPAFGGPQPGADWIVTNPPFGERSLPFALRALELARVGVALFVRQQWLEGVGRYEALFGPRPPALVAQFAERVNLKKGSWDPEGDTLTSYCWVVWLRGAAPPGVAADTRLMWIAPGQRTALTRPDDVERFTAHPVRAPASGEETPHPPFGHLLPLRSLHRSDRSQSDRVEVPQGEKEDGDVPQGEKEEARPGFRFTSADDAVLRAAYALPAEQFDLAIVAATIGCSREQARKRASHLGIARAEHQRLAVAAANRRRAARREAADA